MPHDRAFSLIELVIVILIIATVSAIAIPRISRASQNAELAGLQADLKVLREAIELYAIEHGGKYPGQMNADGKVGGLETDSRAQLLEHTDSNGKVGTYDPKIGVVFGPYLHKIPELPVPPGGDAFMHDGDSPPTPNGAGGWVYNPATAEIAANVEGRDSTGTLFNRY